MTSILSLTQGTDREGGGGGGGLLLLSGKTATARTAAHY